ncbi:MAG TPA: hypothetical protein VKS82_27125 [Streptosporangiaceae bacterium]|nr:hypothetical protein [Streptosporangiaceae bacterium]
MRGYGLAAGLLATAVAGLHGASWAGAAPAGAAPAGAAVTWHIVAPPPPAGALWTAVSARTDSDAWAVAQGGASRPLVARWNGTAWSDVTGPTVPGATSTVPEAAGASSASDAWLVGRATVSRVTSTLAAHWDGTSWSVVATPHVAGSVLTSVADIAPGVAYAVGRSEALQWNGSTWSAFSVPAPGGAQPAILDAVAGDSPSDVWITGQYFDPATSADEPFTAHWNGTAWASVPVPVNKAELFGLTVVSPSDAWAAGNTFSGSAVTEHWTGKTWHVVPNPAKGLLVRVTATGPRNVTAVGYKSSPNGPVAGIILTWNGSSWVNDTVPVAGATRELFATSAAPGGHIIWAFGSSTSSSGIISSLTLRHG